MAIDEGNIIMRRNILYIINKKKKYIIHKTN